MKNLKTFENYTNSNNWLEKFEKFLEYPWQEDTEIEIVNMLSEYKDQFKKSPEQTRKYFDEWNKFNSDSINYQLVSDSFLNMYQILTFHDYPRRVEEKLETEKIYDLSELYHIEKWIESVWDRLEKMEEETLQEFFHKVEETCGEDVATIIDGMYNADKLHYFQSGKTTTTGGIDTGDFIINFEDYKSTVENILSDYIN